MDVAKFSFPIDSANNAKAISELSLYNDEVIRVMRKPPKEIPNHELVEDGKLVPKMDKIVEDWFIGYANEQGLMSIDDLKRLANDKWKGSHLYQHMAELMQTF